VRRLLPLAIALVWAVGLTTVGPWSVRADDQATTAPSDDEAAPDTERPDSIAGQKVFRVPIEGIIDLGLAPFVARVVEEATAAEAGVVLLDIDTFGGRVDAAVMIRDALIEAKVPTIAVINPRAISAGALISLACEHIVMTAGGTIGAVTPVQQGGGEQTEAVEEKIISYMRTEMRATAERRGRDGDVAAAMVDPDVVIEDVTAEGKVLTLTTEQALSLGIADLEVADLADALAQLGLGEAEVIERLPNWAEKLARAISNPAVSSLLLSLGFLGIMIELYQPGWGLPGTLGLVALIVFFFGHHVVNLAGLEELLLFALGVALLLLELFVIPGFGVAGVAGGMLILVAAVLSLIGLDIRIAWDLGQVREAIMVVAASMLTTMLGAFLMIRLLPATGLDRRIVLKETLQTGDGYSSHAITAVADLPVGTDAVALRDLRPAGLVRAGDRRLDAVSEGDYIEAGATVTIVAWRGGTAVVRARTPEAS